MKRNVLVLAFIAAFLGFGLITPTTNFETISMQLDNLPTLEYTPAAPGDNAEIYVEQISNLHTPADKGSHSAFSNLQALDTTMDTLTEENLGDLTIDEYLFVDGFSGTHAWTLTGTSPYLDAVDGTNYISTNTDTAVDEWYSFADTTGTTGTFAVNASIYFISTDGNDDFYW